MVDKNFFNIYLIMIICLLIIPTNETNWKNFPEDITSLDYLTYSTSEYFLVAYYYCDPHVAALPAVKKDYRNGILIYPFAEVKFVLKHF